MNAPLEVDHFIYATPDVDRSAAEIGERLGVEFRVGGRHPDWGTRNAILPLGDRCYFEVIGPDASNPNVEGGRILGLDDITEPRLAWWAVRPFLMPLTCGEFETAGFIPGDVIGGSREKPDGTTLSWQLTDPRVVLCDGILPMVIDWEGDEHPGDDSVGVSLGGYELHHPDADELSGKFGNLGLAGVRKSETPSIVVQLDGPKGRVTLR